MQSQTFYQPVFKGSLSIPSIKDSMSKKPTRERAARERVNCCRTNHNKRPCSSDMYNTIFNSFAFDRGKYDLDAFKPVYNVKGMRYHLSRQLKKYICMATETTFRITVVHIRKNN